MLPGYNERETSSLRRGNVQSPGICVKSNNGALPPNPSESHRHAGSPTHTCINPSPAPTDPAYTMETNSQHSPSQQGQALCSVGNTAMKTHSGLSFFKAPKSAPGSLSAERWGRGHTHTHRRWDCSHGHLPRCPVYPESLHSYLRVL